jgi:hypothetical protein
MVLNPGRDFESEQGSIPVEAIVDTGTGWRTPTRRGALFIFASYAAGRLVGISVGIGSNRRGKLLYIQMVIALVEYRPGAPIFAAAQLGFGRPLHCIGRQSFALRKRPAREFQRALVGAAGKVISTPENHSGRSAEGFRRKITKEATRFFAARHSF